MRKANLSDYVLFLCEFWYQCSAIQKVVYFELILKWNNIRKTHWYLSWPQSHLKRCVCACVCVCVRVCVCVCVCVCMTKFLLKETIIEDFIDTCICNQSKLSQTNTSNLNGFTHVFCHVNICWFYFPSAWFYNCLQFYIFSLQHSSWILHENTNPFALCTAFPL